MKFICGVLVGSLALGGCGAATAAQGRNPLDCGVALTIEAYNARTHGSAKLAEDLSPIIKWYIVKGAELPADQRTQEHGVTLMERFKADVALRKQVAKACVTEAMTDPVYHKVLPELSARVANPLTK